MDIEADIRALQLDSAEENNGVGVVVPAGQNTNGVEILDKLEEDLKDEVQESTPIPDVQVKPAPAVTEFVAHVQIVKLPANAIFIAGYKAILHIHAVVEECEIIELISHIDLKTRKPIKRKKLCLCRRMVLLSSAVYRLAIQSVLKISQMFCSLEDSLYELMKGKQLLLEK